MAEEVAGYAKQGLLNGNPRLLHRVTCPKCGCESRTFLDLLKSGEFEVGDRVSLVVTYPGGAYLYAYEQETATPIYLKTTCKKCGHEGKITDPVLTVEYLSGVVKLGKPGIVSV